MTFFTETFKTLPTIQLKLGYQPYLPKKNIFDRMMGISLILPFTEKI